MQANQSQFQGRELISTRVLAAPPDLAWKLWTDPEHLARWWGPFGFSLTTHSMDLRVGGLWHFTMHGPDGTDFPNYVRYTDLEVGKLLAYEQDNGADAAEPIHFRVQISFTELGGGDDVRTLVAMRHLFDTPEELFAVESKYGVSKGGQEHFARMIEYAAKVRQGLHDKDDAHLTWGQADDLEWQELPHGQRIKLLCSNQGIGLVLSEVPAGCVGPVHFHPGPESIYVLEGSVISNGIELKAGCGAIHSGGTEHREFRSETGARFLVVFTLPSAQ
jgi:uncharacterized protein YndB with AHSA1/START domain